MRGKDCGGNWFIGGTADARDEESLEAEGLPELTQVQQEGRTAAEIFTLSWLPGRRLALVLSVLGLQIFYKWKGSL